MIPSCYSLTRRGACLADCGSLTRRGACLATLGSLTRRGACLATLGSLTRRGAWLEGPSLPLWRTPPGVRMRHQSTSRRPTMDGFAPGVGSGLPSPAVGRSLRASCPSLTACPLRFALRASLAPTARRRGSAAPRNREPHRCPFVAHASRRANAASIDLATSHEGLPRPVVDRCFFRDSKCVPSRSSVRRLRKSAA
jgi:hypothetical protein